tara:strand:- start:5071 stop:6120 length:1050 start_codon:yes stop_codon:yes gene_type:complete
MGYSVLAVAPVDEYVPLLTQLNCHYLPIEIDNSGTHPGRDLQLLWRYLNLLRREKGDIVLTYTIKPNIFGSIAARLCSIPVINNISGLGAVFIDRSWVTGLVVGLYQLSLAGSKKIFFQNRDDQQYFVKAGLVKEQQTECLPGSGVDLSRFSYSPITRSSKNFRFLLVARLLWDKGVREFVSVAREFSQKYRNIDFCLLGQVDTSNPTSISIEQVEMWSSEGIIKYLGEVEDVRPYLQEADCVVLPSYREGTPRSLLEAAAIGRPIVTTNAVGCRETVIDGRSGLLCRVRDVKDLAEKMSQILELSFTARLAMGLKGRKHMENTFDENIVIDRYVSTIQQTLNLQGAPE